MFLNGPSKATSCSLSIHHDLLLNFSEESLFEGTDRTYNNIQVQFPFPVVNPKASIEPPKDAVITLLEEKEYYLDLLEKKRKRYKYDLIHIEKKTVDNKKFISLPKHLLEFYQTKDPDVSFHCDYNYYYTNGILESLEIEGKYFLIYPDRNNELFLLNTEELEEPMHIEFRTDTPVHNIWTVQNSPNSLFIVREKFTLNIMNLDENKKAVVLYQHNYKNPLLDAKANPSNLSHVGIIWANGNVNVNDVLTSRPLLHYRSLEGKTEETCDNFQQLNFFNNNSFCLMDRYKINIFDYRTKSRQSSFDPKLIDCNNLCNFKIVDNSILLASRHYIMKTDIRYLDKVSSYSHTLTMAPCYMDTALKDDDTYLAVASHHHDHKVIFTGRAPYSLPYKVPSLIDTLTETLLTDPTLILHNQDFENRFKVSLAGLKILNLGGDICLFTCNSFGEVFKQRVFEEHAENEEPLQVFSEWLKKVELPEPTLHLTYVEELSNIRFSLNTLPDKQKLEKYKKNGKVDEFLDKYEHKYLTKNVTSSWARKFTSVWEDSDESDEDDKINGLPEVPVADKVGEWIDENEFDDAELYSSFKES